MSAGLAHYFLTFASLDECLREHSRLGALVSLHTGQRTEYLAITAAKSQSRLLPRIVSMRRHGVKTIAEQLQWTTGNTFITCTRK